MTVTMSMEEYVEITTRNDSKKYDNIVKLLKGLEFNTEASRDLDPMSEHNGIRCRGLINGDPKNVSRLINELKKISK